MKETSGSPAAARPVLHTVDEEPVGADAARLLYADDARRLSVLARRLVATERDHAPGDYVHEALLVLRRAERLVDLAIVVERTRGSLWDEIGAGSSGITKQSVQRRWAVAADPVDALAEDLEAWYLQNLEDADDTDRPVSGYLTRTPAQPGPDRRVPAEIIRLNLLEAP